MHDLISDLEPGKAVIDFMRTMNVIVGIITCGTLLFLLALPRWHEWNVRIRLGWMSLFMLCLTGTYGSFEARYLDTHLRVPMVTVSLIWAIVAAVWPMDKGPNAQGKR
jgi:hypothetical protein